MVFVKIGGTKTLSLDVDPNSTSVDALKHEIQINSGVPVPLQRIFLSARSITTATATATSIADLGVRRNSTLTLHFQLLGGMQAPVTDLTAVGEGRGTVLSLKLDRLSDYVSGVTVVDPKVYLTDLKSMKITSDAEISDIKKARLLFKSVIQTNPKHPPGWIAAARLEEVAGKIQMARDLIKKGCEECPKNEDVWIEACRLSNPEEAKAVIAKGVKAIPNSVKLWMQAAKLEHDD